MDLKEKIENVEDEETRAYCNAVYVTAHTIKEETEGGVRELPEQMGKYLAQKSADKLGIELDFSSQEKLNAELDETYDDLDGVEQARISGLMDAMETFVTPLVEDEETRMIFQIMPGEVIQGFVEASEEHLENVLQEESSA